MRWSTFVKRQPAQPVSDDPADVFEHGVAPRHHLTSPLHTLQRGQLVPQSFGGILVRLPRRLSKIVAEDAHRWVRGEPPISVEPAPSRWGTRAEWERAYPGLGLGLPKPLPRRRGRPRRHDEFARVRPALDLAIQAIERSALALVEGRRLSEIWQMVVGEKLAGVGHRTLYDHGVQDVRLDVRLVNDPHSRGLVDPARPTLGLQIYPRWIAP